MTSFRTGDVILVGLEGGDSASKRTKLPRLALVISSDVVNQNLQTVIVCPVAEARKVAESRMGATLIPKGVIGLDHDVVVFSLQIRTIPKSQIVKRISSLPPPYLSQIRESLQAVLAIN